MAKLEIGVQFWPWYSTPDLLAYAERALKEYPFDCVWMCDEFQYEDAFTTMAAMALRMDTSVGTMVTFPWRNPLDLAQRFASIAKLARPGRYAAAGLGAGGTVQVQVLDEKANPVEVCRESVELLRGLFAGESVALARFPQLGSRFLYNPSTRARLYFPPPEPVPVYLAAAAPKMYEVAGALADGVILTQLNVRTCYPAAKAGLVREGMEAVDAARARANGSRPFKKIYAFHVSVSKNGEAARQWAKRNTSYALSGGYTRYPKALSRLGLDPQEIAYVAEAYLTGLGVDEAARRVSDSLVERAGLVFAGTPDKVAEQCVELKQLLAGMGFDHLVVGVPLGPDVPEALELLTKEILPAIVG